MTCATCNAAVQITKSTPHGEGRFKEEYECANNHHGVITGNEEEPPKNWTKRGAVFESYE